MDLYTISLPNYPNAPFYQMIAVSQTPDPTGSWYRWQFSFSDMPDYPKFGVWPDGYYMSANRFASGQALSREFMPLHMNARQCLQAIQAPG